MLIIRERNRVNVAIMNWNKHCLGFSIFRFYSILAGKHIGERHLVHYAEHIQSAKHAGSDRPRLACSGHTKSSILKTKHAKSTKQRSTHFTHTENKMPFSSSDQLIQCYKAKNSLHLK